LFDNRGPYDCTRLLESAKQSHADLTSRDTRSDDRHVAGRTVIVEEHNRESGLDKRRVAPAFELDHGDGATAEHVQASKEAEPQPAFRFHRVAAGLQANA
jgi:hypothetical protein